MKKRKFSVPREKNWKKDIYEIMKTQLPICTTKRMGRMVIGRFGGHEGEPFSYEFGMRRLMSKKENKGMTRRQVYYKIIRYCSEYLSQLVHEGRVRTRDTHTFLRKVYYIPEYEHNVTPFIVSEIREGGNLLLSIIYKFFSEFDTATYSTIKEYLKEKGLREYSKYTIKRNLKVLLELKVIKKTNFSQTDMNITIYHKPELSHKTIRENMMKERFRLEMLSGEARERGLEYEKKILKMLKKKGYKIEPMTFFSKQFFPHDSKIQFDGIGIVEMPFMDEKIDTLVVLEMKSGLSYQLSLKYVERFITKLRNFDRRSVIPIMITKYETSHAVQEKCKNNGIWVMQVV